MDVNDQCSLTDEQWSSLINSIKYRDCTPFLGAGACAGYIPLGRELAKKWAAEIKYPFEDKSDLVQVAQYRAITSADHINTKRELIERLVPLQIPNYLELEEPLGILASLPMPVYVTTNYDSLMFDALEAHGKQPKRAICQWNDDTRLMPSILDTDYIPSAQEPLVYHLHGYKEVPSSIVVTEDDYIDFLLELTEGSDNLHILPPIIQQSLRKVLFFVGYRMSDVNLRVLLRSLLKAVAPSQTRLRVILQLPPSFAGDDATKQAQQSYFEKYYSSTSMKLQVIWCDAKHFISELMMRWEQGQNE